MEDAFESGDPAYIAQALGLPPGLGHDGDCPVNRSVVRAALSLFQQERQSDITLNAGSRNKGVRKAGHLTCSSRVLPCRQAAGVLKHRIGNFIRKMPLNPAERQSLS